MIDNLLRESNFAEEFIVEGERRMAHIVLEARFGTVAEDILTALHTADQATLQDVVAQAVANQPLERNENVWDFRSSPTISRHTC
ncbi:MAG TPA: hypothetical protein VF510_00085 [Ktedonobacterales bacterium]